MHKGRLALLKVRVKVCIFGEASWIPAFSSSCLVGEMPQRYLAIRLRLLAHFFKLLYPL